MATIKPPKIVMTSGKLKQEYYTASTIVGGSGLAYSAEKGANVVTEAGQLVMDELIKTRPEAAQFQHKGFKFWDHMNQFVPPDKARGTNTHHAGTFSMMSRSSTSITSMLPQPPFMPPVQHYPSHQPPFTQPHTLHQLQSTQAAAQFTFVQYQTETPNWTQTALTTQNV
ncbi:hypothetical protein EDD16DRAFT_1520469 [Pisolithus croceorrhizus]|nr:hypothetical protein EDD16DRAFT_1520469 [Pisolithus croceorrhizus]